MGSMLAEQKKIELKQQGVKLTIKNTKKDSSTDESQK